MPPKIGFVVKGYPRLSETFIAQEMQLLEERGFELEIYSLKGPREKERHPVHEKIKAEIIYIPESFWKSLPAMFISYLAVYFSYPILTMKAELHAVMACFRKKSIEPYISLMKACWLIHKKKLGRSGPKHLHSHFVHSPTELTFYVAKITGITFSISAHAKDIYTSTASEIRERVQASQFLMTCTEYNFQKIREIVGPQHAAKVNKVYHGVDLEAFTGAVIQNDFPPRRLLTVARLVDKKGYDDVLHAVAMLKKEGLELHYDIYGEGALRSHIEKWVQELELGSNVTLHGAVTQPAVLSAYKNGGVFVLASRESEGGDRDGIPNSMAEALSMQLPVVATDVSGIPELIENEKTGLLVPQRDPVAFAKALKRIYSEPGLAQRLGAEARKKVNLVFDAERCMDVCEALLAPFGK